MINVYGAVYQSSGGNVYGAVFGGSAVVPPTPTFGHTLVKTTVAARGDGIKVSGGKG